jgi:hypothetical protein
MAEQQTPQFPPIPEHTVQEGGRWRFHKPSSEQVANWFKTQPLDEGMEHDHYVGGVVLIPNTEKVKYQTERGTTERHEMVWTAYMQIGTRIGYWRRLAELRGLVPVIRPAAVPRSSAAGSPYFNANMPEGFWYHTATTDQGSLVRYLCCTMVAEMYEPQSFADRLKGREAMPVLQGVGTKQGSAGSDPNALMRLQTSAIGRALGAAGILVIGTGVATADDMSEPTAFGTPTPEPQLPATPETAVTAVSLRERVSALSQELQGKNPQQSALVQAWYRERAATEGWKSLNDVPTEGLQAIVKRLEEALS